MEDAAAPTKPREALDLEQDIKENEIKLRLLKPRAFEIVEAEDVARAKKLNREITGTNALHTQEELRVEKLKAGIKKVIWKDQARLEEIYPDSARTEVKYSKQDEAKKALGVITAVGDKLSRSDSDALTKIVKES